MLKALSLAAAALLLSSCGMNACTSGFVQDYNKVVRSVRYALTKSDLSKARDEAEAFRSQYEGVRCEAQLVASDTPELIDATSKMNELIRGIDSALAR